MRYQYTYSNSSVYPLKVAFCTVHKHIFDIIYNYDHKSKNRGKDHKSIQSCTTPDQGHHTAKLQKHNKNHTQVSPFPAGDNKAAMNRQESMTNTKHKL